MARDEATTAQESADTPTPAPKKKKKLIKSIKDTVIAIEVVGGANGNVDYDFNDLPEGTKGKLGPFGLSHKLGDAAAGKSGLEAEEAIKRVWDGLMKDEWSTRAPATPKVAVNEVMSNLANLSPEEKAAAEALLAKLGIPVPAPAAG